MPKLPDWWELHVAHLESRPSVEGLRAVARSIAPGSTVERVPVPAPEPVALDTRGTWFGVPALVMRQLPGRPDVRAKHLDRWLEEIARVQIQIHSASRKLLPPSLRDPIYPDGWKPPRNVRRTRL